MRSLVDTDVMHGGEGTGVQRVALEKFRRFRRLAANRFYRVDKQLKQMCGELRDVGSSLGGLLARLDPEATV